MVKLCKVIFNMIFYTKRMMSPHMIPQQTVLQELLNGMITLHTWMKKSLMKLKNRGKRKDLSKSCKQDKNL